MSPPWHFLPPNMEDRNSTDILMHFLRYNHFLKDSKKYGVYKGLAVGTSIGSVYFLIFMVYSVSFWWVSQKSIHSIHITLSS